MKFALTVLSSIFAVGVFFIPAQAADKSINDFVQIETVSINNSDKRFGHEDGA